jgi:hypothetical protein
VERIVDPVVRQWLTDAEDADLDDTAVVSRCWSVLRSLACGSTDPTCPERVLLWERAV